MTNTLSLSHYAYGKGRVERKIVSLQELVSSFTKRTLPEPQVRTVQRNCQCFSVIGSNYAL